MGQEKEIELRKKAFNGYKITLEMMKESPDAVFMHCLPANRGEEVDGDVMDSDHSVIWTQAENRLHAQKAILIDLLK